MSRVLKANLLQGSLLADQIALEQSAIDAGVLRYRKLADQAVTRGDGSSLKPAERWLIRWVGPVTDAIAKDRRAFKRGDPDIGTNVWGPVLECIDPDVAALCAIRETLSACMANPDGVPVVTIANAIGRDIIAEIARNLLRKSQSEQVRTLPDGTTATTTSSEWSQLCAKFKTLSTNRVNWWAGKRVAADMQKFGQKARTHVGSRLLWSVIEHCNCADEPGAFRLAFHRQTVVAHCYFCGEGRGFIPIDQPCLNCNQFSPRRAATSCIMADRRVYDLIAAGHDIRAIMRPRFQPMIVPPYPFVQNDDGAIEGGYATIRTPIVAKPTRAQKAALAKADLSTIFEHQSALSATPLRINCKIRDVQREFFAGGGNVAGIPSARAIPMPEKPADWTSLPEPAQKEWKRLRVLTRRDNIRRSADVVEYLTRTAVAEQFGDQAAIWFPHQLDFRSRAYPIPAHLNFHGDDVCRGLLELGDAKPLGDNGERNLALHAANCYGLDKVSISQRLAWVDQNGDNIRKAAAEPLDFAWWQSAKKKPWQFLAACMAIADPDGAGQTLPVQRDGTCNGLQHYAAMGRDPVTAKLVNMFPALESDTPEDVYGAVAFDTDKQVQIDAITNPAQHILAVCGIINRDIAKPVVMPKTYGVTLVGARKGISKLLKQAGVPKEVLYQSAMYLAKRTMESLAVVCPAADLIMKCLEGWAWRIVTDDKATGRKGEAVGWLTPLGFPVIQPDLKWSSREIRTILQTIRIAVDEDGLPPWRCRQARGIAPNFVHSIDATHMFRTGLAAHRAGLAFVAVHDAFWTHAADADELSAITRREFVRTHEVDLLADLHRQFTEHYRIELPPPPPRGTFDINEVLRALYFFN